MNEIKCPHCGEVFKVDASGYADIVKQVRDAEFSRDLDERVKAVQREGEQALELERSRSTAALQQAESQRNAQLVEQKNTADQKLAQEVAKRDAELAELRAKLEGAAAERESASARRLRHEPMLKKRMPNSSVRLIACVRSLGAKMTKQSLPSRRRATLLKTI